jgi:glutamate dehydrogenase (NAD(P)+)
VITDALEEENKGLEGLRVAVQGFGNVGRHLARMLAEEGAIVVAVSDSSGGIHAAKGLEMPLVLAHKAEHGTLAGFAGADAITNDVCWRSECARALCARAGDPADNAAG